MLFTTVAPLSIEGPAENEWAFAHEVGRGLRHDVMNACKKLRFPLCLSKRKNVVFYIFDGKHVVDSEAKLPISQCAIKLEQMRADRQETARRIVDETVHNILNSMDDAKHVECTVSLEQISRALNPDNESYPLTVIKLVFRRA